MGKLRFEPKHKPPGFTKLRLAEPVEPAVPTHENLEPDPFEATIRLVTREGTVVQLSRDVPLKQVARLVRMLDGSLRL